MTTTNKTIIFLGSSVTEGDNGYSMCEVVRERTDAEVVKWAVSGTTLSTARENSYVERFLKEIPSRDKCDLFITQLSTNDAGKPEIVIGELSDSFKAEDFDTRTVVGAIEFIIATAREKWGCPIAFYTGGRYGEPMYEEMVEALMKVAEKWDIGIIDIFNDEAIHSISDEEKKRYYKDRVHPTRLGYSELWADKFLDYIKSV